MPTFMHSTRQPLLNLFDPFEATFAKSLRARLSGRTDTLTILCYCDRFVSSFPFVNAVDLTRTWQPPFTRSHTRIDCIHRRSLELFNSFYGCPGRILHSFFQLTHRPARNINSARKRNSLIFIVYRLNVPNSQRIQRTMNTQLSISFL